MNLIIFGPQGAGKGTQASLLVERFGLTQVSTGDLFRAAIKEGTPLGREAKGYIDAGNLVPDKVTIGLVEHTITALGDRGFILDGFPRNVAQADALNLVLRQTGRRIDRVIFLEVPLSDLMGRLTGRRVCERCGTVYHVSARPTKVAGRCDKCGGPVTQRQDDKEEDVIRTRLEAYERSTMPLKEYYKAKGHYVVVDGTGSSEDVFGRIAEALRVKA